jgi:hypothetical protein
MSGEFLVAQNLGEYSGVGSSISEGLSHLREVVAQQLRDVTPLQWAVIGGAFVVLWLAFRFRR